MKCAVIGLGVEGLLASWVMQQHPHIEVTAIGSRPTTPDRIEIAHAESAANLMRILEVPCAGYRPKRGALVRGDIIPCTKDVDDVIREKSRGDLGANGSRMLRFDAGELRDRIEPKLKVVLCDDWRLEKSVVVTSRGARIQFDIAIITVPLWSLRRRVFFHVPRAIATRKTGITVKPLGFTKLFPWDVVALPYTPENSAYRSTSTGRGFFVEAVGGNDWPGMIGDLNFLFQNGYEIMDVANNLRGEPLPMNSLVEWPRNVFPVGKFVEWKQTAIDQVIDRSYTILKQVSRGSKK